MQIQRLIKKKIVPQATVDKYVGCLWQNDALQFYKCTRSD